MKPIPIAASISGGCEVISAVIIVDEPTVLIAAEMAITLRRFNADKNGFSSLRHVSSDYRIHLLEEVPEEDHLRDEGSAEKYLQEIAAAGAEHTGLYVSVHGGIRVSAYERGLDELLVSSNILPELLLRIEDVYLKKLLEREFDK